MIKSAWLTLLCLFAALFLPVCSPGEDLLLYTPKPAESEVAPKSPDEGVLVKSVTVKRGDTLKKLSRKHLGRSSWFPQVLVFNEIKNPDLIQPGEKVKIPVPAGKSAAAEKGRAEKTHARHRKSHHGHRTRAHHAATPHTEAAGTPASTSQAAQPMIPETAKPGALEAAKPSAQEPVKPATREAVKPATPRAAKTPQHHEPPITSAEQEAFQQAKLAYLRGDYRKSLPLLNDFLRNYPNSPIAADAALYRADCLLHLSGT